MVLDPKSKASRGQTENAKSLLASAKEPESKKRMKLEGPDLKIASDGFALSRALSVDVYLKIGNALTGKVKADTPVKVLLTYLSEEAAPKYRIQVIVSQFGQEARTFEVVGADPHIATNRAVERIARANFRSHAPRQASASPGESWEHRTGTRVQPTPVFNVSDETVSADESAVRISDLTRFREVFRLDPTARIEAIKTGVEAREIARIAQSMDISKEQLSKTLGLSISTIDRKVRSGEKLSPEQGERVVAIARLIGQVQTMVEESGDPSNFDAARWMAGWLGSPLPALGGTRPWQYMDTAEGRELIANLLQMIYSGAYA